VKSKKEFRFLISLLVTILLAQNAGAAQSVVVAYNSPGAKFDVVGASAIVDKDASKLFRDTGQISNRMSAAGLSLSREQMWEGVNAWSPGINNDPMHHYVDPVWWTVTASPVQSLDFLFADVADAGERWASLQFAGEQRTILEQQPVARWECTHDGRFTYANIGTGIAHVGRHKWSMDF
jgi:hypothetical protein